MSRYLIQRIEENPNIEIHYRTEIISLEGDSHLEHVTWRNNQTGEISTSPFATFSSWPAHRREPNG